ncbi:transcription factor TFIIE subunit TFA2 SCDLUD_004570 [Saccharomycodes ludwigii]|uniref:transcription factor TFIIE subunit TFA2 n=1 Tax=Saccharomycodes ludwigii TaxID=36035 RepID=UPI001E84D4C5|nr:hypothetical protein SCDLUD_004570 [Saccharomycodes ludwigii]KAH3899143.1 hypothetical protein SCDLUD_004570 [Saccharomycodes ludwigii]
MSTLLDNLNKVKHKIEGPKKRKSEEQTTIVTATSDKENTPVGTSKSDTASSNLAERPADGLPSKKLKSNPSEKVELTNTTKEKEEDKAVSPSKSLSATLTTNSNGPGLSGTHLSTKLLLATEYIQERGEAVPISQVESYLSLKPNSPEAKNVIQLLKNINKIKFDPVKKTLQYVSIYDVHSAGDLIDLLRKQATFKGISVKELKDGWPQCQEVIDDLEKRGRILVLRTKKDGSARFVWYNNYVTPAKVRQLAMKNEDGHIIDEEFRKMWEKCKLPSRAELPRKLTDFGLKPASVDPASVKKEGTVTRVEVKKRKQRKSKITNTHMTGVLRDYSDRV